MSNLYSEVVMMEKVELVETIKSQKNRIESLSKRLDLSASQRSEVSKLKFKWQEFSSLADKLQSTEIMLEKYKRKADEAYDNERAMKVRSSQLLGNGNTNARASRQE
jgi:RNA-splicing ligase RtcB